MTFPVRSQPADRSYTQFEKKQCSEWRSKNSYYVYAHTSSTVPLNVMGAFESLSSVVLGSLFRKKKYPIPNDCPECGI